MSGVQVVRESDSRLERNVWRFWTTVEPNGTIKVVLDAYAEESRPSTRHNYKATANYQRIDKRYCSIQSVAMVPQPTDVRNEAMQQVIANIRVIMCDARGVEAMFGKDAQQADLRAPLRWEPVPYGRGNVEAFVDVPGIGRYLVSRAGPRSREFYVRVNGGPVIHRGTSDDCKRWVQLTVDEHRVTKAGL